jgi:hypothetical protein
MNGNLRVEGWGNFGKPNGEFGTVRQADEDDAVVKLDCGLCALWNFCPQIVEQFLKRTLVVVVTLPLAEVPDVILPDFFRQVLAFVGVEKLPIA